MIILKNENLYLEINETGAEIRKITLDGVDALWNGDPAFWTGTAPLLFPICGGLKDDKFTYEGREYTLLKHGFARFCLFEVENKTETQATFLLSSSPETLKSYPWEFELRVTYALSGKSIAVLYDVKNMSDTDMYASIGSHEAYACPEGIEAYDVIFPQKETLESHILVGNLLSGETLPIIKDSCVLPLKQEYFKVDALVFKDLKSRSAALRNRETGREISVDFPGCDYFLIWTKPNANYICLEPWSGIPALLDAGYDIKEKEGINKIPVGSSYSLTHTIHL